MYCTLAFFIHNNYFDIDPCCCTFNCFLFKFLNGILLYKYGTFLYSSTGRPLGYF